MAAEVVHDHHVAWAECRDQDVADMGEEDLAVDRPVEQAGRVDPVVTQRGDEGHGLPAAEGRLALHPRATGTPGAHTPWWLHSSHAVVGRQSQ
jgi:hypothetical protein